ncbi:MAG: cysteine synthase A [Candidatus Dadabacteria bacterium]|nr:cysteine synthase A [Candidatus Dadabacteria bacterium]
MNLANRQNNVVDSMLNLIGNTPVIKLNNLIPPDSAVIWAKLENLNPAGSTKDRICLSMIEAAEKDGSINPQSTVIVDATSGNTGIGLALVCAIKGYKLILTMPDDRSMERRQLLAAYGAEVILTPANELMNGAIKKAHEIAEATPNSFMVNQFSNKVNTQAHRETTGTEIMEQIPGKIDAFVAGVGTGGTISGVGEILKKSYPDIHLVAVEPKECAVLSGGKANVHEIQGIGPGFIPEILTIGIYDEIIPVSTEDAQYFTREIALKEGLLVGISAGAAGYAALKIAERLGKGKQVVTIFCDTGERYLSTGLFD